MTHRVIEERDFTTRGADTWLFCIDCTRFFQHRDLRTDATGRREKCAFCEYTGFGFGVFPWNAFREGKHWPATDAELSHGAKAPPPIGLVGPAVAYRIGATKTYRLAWRTAQLADVGAHAAATRPQANRRARRAMAKWRP